MVKFMDLSIVMPASVIIKYSKIRLKGTSDY